MTVSMIRFIEKKDFANAYRMACLGVTEQDWRYLATESLKNYMFEISKKSFGRIKDIRFMELITKIESSRVRLSDEMLQAEI